MIDLVAQPYKCNHCNKSFMQEKTLVAHMCERKRRALQRDEKRVQAGYMAFNRWWQLAQGYTKFKTLLLMTSTGAFPCGACRQIIYEYCQNVEIIVATDKDIIKICSIQELMPYVFNSLDSKNI